MELDKMIQILKAYQEGKTIELRPKVARLAEDVVWVPFNIANDSPEHQFNFDSYEYRIVRIPQEYYIVERDDGALLGRLSYAPAKSSYPPGTACRKMVEDITWEWK